MKTILVRWFPALLVFGALIGAPPRAAAQAEVTERPISDFLETQGTFDFGFLVVPPVPNFLGFIGENAELSMAIDYAGLADDTCDAISGTTIAGSVTEKPLPDGRAEVTVQLRTTGAIAWVIEGADFGNGPVIFGVRWEEDQGGNCVIDGAPALGNSLLKVTFTNTAPGAPLPDLIQLLVAPEPGQELLAFFADADASGTLPDGTPARAGSDQAAKVVDGVLTFFVENVFVRSVR